MNHADPRNENALRTKTASRPNHAATTPPNDAPAARQNDHVTDASAFAVITRSAGTMFGITLVWAGSKNAAPMVSTKSSGYTSHTIAGLRTVSMHSTTKNRATSAPIMMRLRLMRSLSTPAVGAASVL